MTAFSSQRPVGLFHPTGTRGVSGFSERSRDEVDLSDNPALQPHSFHSGEPKQKTDAAQLLARQPAPTLSLFPALEAGRHSSKPTPPGSDSPCRGSGNPPPPLLSRGQSVRPPQRLPLRLGFLARPSQPRKVNCARGCQRPPESSRTRSAAGSLEPSQPSWGLVAMRPPHRNAAIAAGPGRIR